MEAQPGRPRVLIVNDTSENIQLLTEMLHGDCIALTASNGVQALKIANEDPAPDVILLDLTMPGMDGYEVCTRLKSEPKTRDIPVIFLAAASAKLEEHKGLEVGGADYSTRPYSPHLVKARIRHRLEIKHWRSLRRDTAAGHASKLNCAGLEPTPECSHRKGIEEKLRQVNCALELRLAEKDLQLTAAREELRHESGRRAEDRLEIGLLNQNLGRQSRDLETVSQELAALSFSISHDLRAPLRHLLGFSGALIEDYGDSLDSTGQNFLGCITKAAHKLESQIEALLGLSRVARQELTFASVDLTELVRESAASLQSSAPERLAVFTIADRLVVRADAALLQGAVDNLLGNAWKFTGKKEQARIEFGCKREGDAEIFFLSDNGAGFDMRYADRLFGAFQRMHNDSEFEGTGIGLATAQRIIRRHGGRIWADATVDGGATFFFTLSQ